MAHNLAWCSSNGKTAHLIDYLTVLSGSIPDNRVYRSANIDAKSKDMVNSKVNLKLKFRKDNYLLENCVSGRL